MDNSVRTKIAIVDQEIEQWQGVLYQSTIRIKIGKEAGLGEDYMTQQMVVAEKAQKMIDGLRHIRSELKGEQTDAV